MKIRIAALNIVKMLPIGRNMRDSIWKTRLVMMAEPEEFAETEKGENRARSKVTGPTQTQLPSLRYGDEPVGGPPDERRRRSRLGRALPVFML